MEFDDYPQEIPPDDNLETEEYGGDVEVFGDDYWKLVDESTTEGDDHEAQLESESQSARVLNHWRGLTAADRESEINAINETRAGEFPDNKPYPQYPETD